MLCRPLVWFGHSVTELSVTEPTGQRDSRLPGVVKLSRRKQCPLDSVQASSGSVLIIFWKCSNYPVRQAS